MHTHIRTRQLALAFVSAVLITLSSAIVASANPCTPGDMSCHAETRNEQDEMARKLAEEAAKLAREEAARQARIEQQNRDARIHLESRILPHLIDHYMCDGGLTCHS